MRIAVIGAGLAGVTTAYELALDGHDVLVLDQASGIASEGSFANGGLVAPAYLAAWGAPGLPRRLWSPPWRACASWWRDGLSTAAMPWLWQRRAAQRAPVRSALQDRLWALADYSQSRLAHLSKTLMLDYEVSPGHLVLLRDGHDLDRLRPGLTWLAEHGVAHQLLDGAGARLLEPALDAQTALEAAIHLPGDRAANSRQFAHLIKAQAQSLGVQWRFFSEVLSIEPGRPWRVVSRWRRDPLEADAQRPAPASTQSDEVDAVVLCAPASAAALTSTMGLRLPLAAVDGHSITASVRLTDSEFAHLPLAGVLDERHQVSIARQGDRLRVSGGAQLKAPASKLNPQVLARLYRVLQDWFPGAAQTARAMQWRGTRWVTPDDLPLVGASGVPGLWLNVGLGAAGWTLACGNARLLADQVAERPAAVDALSVRPNRFGT